VIRLGDVLDTSAEPEVATAALALDRFNPSEGAIGPQPTADRADTTVALTVATIDVASLIGAADDPSNETPVV
jgi:hypothetical protein